MSHSAWRFAALLLLFQLTGSPGISQEPFLGSWPEGIINSGAVGERFTFHASVPRLQYLPGEAIPLDLLVRGKGKVACGPAQLEIELYPALADKFAVQFLSSVAFEEKKEWLFRFTLKPKEKGILEIASLPLAFVNPAIPWSSRRGMLEFSNSLLIEVGDREALAMPLVGPAEAFNPQELFQAKGAWLFSPANLDEFFWLMLSGPFAFFLILGLSRQRRLARQNLEKGNPGWVKKSLAEAAHLPLSQQPRLIWGILQAYLNCQFPKGPKTWTARDFASGASLPFLANKEREELLGFWEQLEAALFSQQSPGGCLWAPGALHGVSILEARR
ncbi:MAG: hypothetical protein EXR99_14995 [Gemmataceae bacterium]|nr:hypothetical protein [Gemmataceae bacterium]